MAPALLVRHRVDAGRPESQHPCFSVHRVGRAGTAGTVTARPPPIKAQGSTPPGVFSRRHRPVCEIRNISYPGPCFWRFRGRMEQEGAASAGPLRLLFRAGAKNPEKLTGDARPVLVSRACAQSGARYMRRRERRAGRRARDTRGKGSRRTESRRRGQWNEEGSRGETHAENARSGTPDEIPCAPAGKDGFMPERTIAYAPPACGS